MAINKLRMFGDPTSALRATTKLQLAFLVSEFLPNVIRDTHYEIENMVRNRFDENTQRDEGATAPGTGAISARIKKNITSTVFRTPGGIFGGTGNTELLDSFDPILDLDRLIKDDSVRLWRILEFGVTGGYPIKPRKAAFIRFFWRKAGVPFKGEVKSHPGQRGRFYFAQTVFEANNLFNTNLRIAIAILLKKNSYGK